MDNLKVYNRFEFKSNVTLSEARMQAVVMERVEKLIQLVDTYNFKQDSIILRFFGDLKSGLGFKIECSDLSTQQNLTKTLKMYLNQCQD